MQHKMLSLLNLHGVMTIATVRPDGWPQATTVCYVNDGYQIYFLISKYSQKYANISADNRVSIAIGSEAVHPEQIEGLSLAAHATELRDEPYRSILLEKLSVRHPGYFDAKMVDRELSALMRASPKVISVVNFSKGIGHTETLTLGADQIVEFEPNRPNDWGPNPAD